MRLPNSAGFALVVSCLIAGCTEDARSALHVRLTLDSRSTARCVLVKAVRLDEEPLVPRIDQIERTASEAQYEWTLFERSPASVVVDLYGYAYEGITGGSCTGKLLQFGITRAQFAVSGQSEVRVELQPIDTQEPVVCAGVLCPDQTCRATTCSAIGCNYDLAKAPGSQCGGGSGRCTDQGACVQPFPYTPSNFTPQPNPTVKNVALNCRAILNSAPDASTPFVQWCDAGIPELTYVAQDGGLPALLVSTGNFVITSDAGLRIIGTHPVIISAYGDALIDGELDVGANGALSGPGSSLATCLGSRGADGKLGGDGGASGGGGGGLRTGGGFGGLAANNEFAQALGAARPSLGTSPLIGGCPGGAGGSDLADDQGGRGGGGGGALQLSAARDLVVTGRISSAGAGGGGGAGTAHAGGGGGSGGSILLEGGRVFLLDAGITANGGGGGQGWGTSAGASGANGSTSSLSRAAGGNDGLCTGAPGGLGAAGQLPATDGGNGGGNNPNNGAGGGGGGTGIIVIKHTTACVKTAATLFSPLPQAGNDCGP